MPKSLFIGLIAAFLLVVFAVQNAAPVPIKLMIWEFNSSLSLVIVICLLFGVVVGSAFTFYSQSMKRKRKALKERVNIEKKVKLGNFCI